MTLAFIVPYRDRVAHLREFVPHIKRRFRKSSIFIIEQGDEKRFNRGKLLNIGFLEFGKQYDYCAYHDIDMLPSKADYSFPTTPTHIATKVQQFRYKMPSDDYFGGVVLFNKEDFIHCGGYSNNFWDWGGEDNEIYFHLRRLNIPIERRSCFFQSLYHKPANPMGFDAEKMTQAKKPRADNDGLKNCKYTVLHVDEFPDYTKITVSL